MWHCLLLNDNNQLDNNETVQVETPGGFISDTEALRSFTQPSLEHPPT